MFVQEEGCCVDGSDCYQFDQHGEVRVEERVTVDDGRKRNADGDQENAVDDAKHPRKEGRKEGRKGGRKEGRKDGAARQNEFESRQKEHDMR
jgi:hypothetical protein